jgi:hypothetical protein
VSAANQGVDMKLVKIAVQGLPLLALLNVLLPAVKAQYRAGIQGGGFRRNST